MGPRWPRRFIAASIVLEAVGIGVGSAGLGVELAYGADIGLVLITGGAVVVATGSLLFAKVFR